MCHARFLGARVITSPRYDVRRDAGHTFRSSHIQRGRADIIGPREIYSHLYETPNETAL